MVSQIPYLLDWYLSGGDEVWKRRDQRTIVPVSVHIELMAEFRVVLHFRRDKPSDGGG